MRDISDWRNRPLYGLSPQVGKSEDSARMHSINKLSKLNKKIDIMLVRVTATSRLLPGLSAVAGNDIKAIFALLAAMKSVWNAHSGRL